MLGAYAMWAIVPALILAYLAILRGVSRQPDLEIDDPNAPMLMLPPLKETVLAGLHYLLPVVLLVWSLLVEELSPGLSAFYATIALIFILLTQKPLMALFRRQAMPFSRVRDWWDD